MSGNAMPGLALARGFLLLLVVIVSIAFVWLIAPFSGAILWAMIAAVLFDPLNRRLARAMPGRRNLPVVATMAVIIGMVIIPAMLLGAALIREAAHFYARIRTGEIDPGRLLLNLQRHLPSWARRWLIDMGLSDVEGVRTRLSEGFANSFQSVAAQLFEIGQGALGFFLALGVMLYLTFFLLRDGHALAARIERAIPLPIEQRAVLLAKFVAVIRATIKGGLIVAILQGSIGGVIFWLLGISGALLWGVAMGTFSLFPAIGTGLIWVPMALYLLASGQIWQGVALGGCGFFIISMVDNLIRPMLIGRDARMPDYVVLIATLGGFELMGFNGFVIGPVIAALFMATWSLVARAPDADR